MSNTSVFSTTIKKVHNGTYTETEDSLAVEEPLEIRLSYLINGTIKEKAISVTMRTPGNDAELATGFLFTEGIISSPEEIAGVSTLPYDSNVIIVTLAANVTPDIARLERNFYTTSSCGVCGKTSIDAVKTVCRFNDQGDTITITDSLVYNLPLKLREVQSVFDITGGLHASALFDSDGTLLLTREDVGRHNALDKLIGTALQNNLLPLSNHILLLSGRASFELIQKASMAGIKIVTAVGAPSSLAVELAKDCDITLIGFLREERFNIYSVTGRINQGA